MENTKPSGIQIPEAQTRKIAAAQSAIKELMIKMDSFPDKTWVNSAGVDITFDVKFRAVK